MPAPFRRSYVHEEMSNRILGQVLLMVCLRQIGEALQVYPELWSGVLEPLKSQGIISADEGGLVVQAKFMARPGTIQYVIRRKVYDRIR